LGSGCKGRYSPWCILSPWQVRQPLAYLGDDTWLWASRATNWEAILEPCTPSDAPITRGNDVTLPADSSISLSSVAFRDGFIPDNETQMMDVAVGKEVAEGAHSLHPFHRLYHLPGAPLEDTSSDPDNSRKRNGTHAVGVGNAYVVRGFLRPSMIVCFNFALGSLSRSHHRHFAKSYFC
jgi:hypothetical protein